MGIADFQLGVADESTYNTAVTVTRFFEFESESIAETEGRTEGDPLRVGSHFIQNDRFTPYFAGAAGTVQMTTLTKGFGYWLKHMLGSVATSGPAETVVYTHTATEGETQGKSFTLQLNRPFTPTGTNQAFTYSGGKVTKWRLNNSVDSHLIMELDVDFAQVSTATALATASYPTGMEPMSWASGLITVGGTNFDVTDFAFEMDMGANVDRRQIRRQTDKKEPTSTRRSATFTLNADFADLTQRARAHAALRTDALAQIVAQWRGPVLLGTTLYPQLTLTLPACRFDSWKANVDGPGELSQELSGVVEWAGTGSPVTLAYQTADTTP